MINLFQHSERNLGRAGWVLVLEFSAAIAAGFLLSQLGLGLAPEYAGLALWVVNPVAAWFLAAAAKVQGRNRVLYGLLALLPPAAIAVFVVLYKRDVELRLSHGSGYVRGA